MPYMNMIGQQSRLFCRLVQISSQGQGHNLERPKLCSFLSLRVGEHMCQQMCEYAYIDHWIRNNADRGGMHGH